MSAEPQRSPELLKHLYHVLFLPVGISEQDLASVSGWQREEWKSGVVAIQKLSGGIKVKVRCLFHKRTVPYLGRWATKLITCEELLTFSNDLLALFRMLSTFFILARKTSPWGKFNLFKSTRCSFCPRYFLLHSMRSAPEVKNCLN